MTVFINRGNGASTMQNKLTYKWAPSALGGVVANGESIDDSYEGAAYPVSEVIDVFKDLTRAGRKNYPHTNTAGELMVADIRINVHVDEQPDPTYFTAGWFGVTHAPLSWSVRNGVKMAQQIRKEQLRLVGKPLRRLSPYNRALTLYLDSFHNSELTPQFFKKDVSTGSVIYMQNYASLASDQYERTKLLTTDDQTGFELSICGTHNGTFPNWSRVSCTQAYHEARVQIPDEFPVINDDNIVVDSPYMSLQKSNTPVDGLTDEIITQLKEERDEVPYDTTPSGDHTELVNGGIMKMGEGLPWSSSTRCQVPAGLLRLQGLIASTYVQEAMSPAAKIAASTVTIEIEVLGIYTM